FELVHDAADMVMFAGIHRHDHLLHVMLHDHIAHLVPLSQAWKPGLCEHLVAAVHVEEADEAVPGRSRHALDLFMDRERPFISAYQYGVEADAPLVHLAYGDARENETEQEGDAEMQQEQYGERTVVVGGF